MPIVTEVTKNGKREQDLFSWEFEQMRKIRLTGQVTDTVAEEIRAKLEYLDEKGHEDIILYINSPGGSVTAGFSIMDAMNNCKSDVRTVCTGIAASMGAFLVSCGAKGKRSIEKSAEMMIHQPLGGAYGQAADVELAAAHIVRVKKRLNSILAHNTGKSLKQVVADTDRDYYLSAEEAVEYGLVDEIL